VNRPLKFVMATFSAAASVAAQFVNVSAMAPSGAVGSAVKGMKATTPLPAGAVGNAMDNTARSPGERKFEPKKGFGMAFPANALPDSSELVSKRISKLTPVMVPSVVRLTEMVAVLPATAFVEETESDGSDLATAQTSNQVVTVDEMTRVSFTGHGSTFTRFFNREPPG